MKPKDFAVFCKKCGTYEVEMYVVVYHDDVIFECQNKECNIKEIL